MIVSRQLTSLALALIFALPAGAAEPDKDGFVPLFNGKDLTGWVNVNCHPSTFFVKDNEIITTGKPTGFLRTDKQYENFIIDFEWMHVNKKEVGNSGLFVWGDPLPAVGTGYTRGIEVQVLVNLEYKNKKGEVTATSHGDLFSIWGAKCKPDRPHPDGWARCLPSENRAKGGGEWNHYIVTAKDGRITLWVNGKEVSGVSECNPRKGYLALESEGAECHFRNIKIKELPSSNPKPEEVANVDQGFKNLYFGDLTGWKVSLGEEGKAHWKPNDWRLVFDGDPKAPSIISDKEYADYELIVDWRALPRKEKDAKPSQPFIQARVSDAGVSNHALGTSAEKPGQWSRSRVTMKGTILTTTLNGKVEQDNVDKKESKRGRIGLSAVGPVEFANIFIRELK
jgi:hypothetical protein